MTREEAKAFLISISHDLGTVGAECLSVKDGKKMRDAIETLEQEHCEDAISRQAVLDAIRKSRFLVDAKQIIDDLPSVTPKQRWIPVSEKLPESDEEYHTFLVTDSKGRVTLSEFYLSVSDEKPYWSGMIDVLAWMPLPEPYKAESEETE